MNQMNGNAQILEAVKKDAGGIGYVGIGYVVDDAGKVVAGINVLEVAKDSRSKPASPFKAGKHHLAAPTPSPGPLYQYFDKNNQAKVEGFHQVRTQPGRHGHHQERRLLSLDRAMEKTQCPIRLLTAPRWKCPE